MRRTVLRPSARPFSYLLGRPVGVGHGHPDARAARQTLQVDLVGVAELQSAVSLDSSACNVSRMIGPVVAGALIAAFGEGVCFAGNAASYSAVLVALLAGLDSSRFGVTATAIASGLVCGTAAVARALAGYTSVEEEAA